MPFSPDSLLFLLLYLLPVGGGAQVPWPLEKQCDEADRDLRVMSYNIRRIAPDGVNAWPNRREFLATQVEFYAPDVLGVQEDFPDQVSWLDERLTGYARVGEGREGPGRGEHCSVFYDRHRFRRLRSGTFWLSETPDTVSTGWDARFPRVVTWVHLFDRRGGSEFLALNTHLDHEGRRARANSINLVLATIDSLNPDGLPTVFVGDLNLRPETPPLQRLAAALTDAFTAAPYRLGPPDTYAGFAGTAPGKRRVDYIMLSPHIEVTNYATLTDRRDGRHPSDHFAILANLRLQPN